MARALSSGRARACPARQVRCDGGTFSVTDGPFIESKELIDGFALLEVASREEAIASAREFMEIAGDGVGEILQVFDPGPLPAR